MNRLGKVIVLNDIRLTREKASALTRILNTIRQFAEVKLVDGNLNEDEFVAQLTQGNGNLVLLPWYRYLSWSKVEAFYGLTRCNGSTVAGYHLGGVTVDEIGMPENLRAILLDFSGPSPTDVARTVRNILVEKKRSGILSFLDGSAPPVVYFEDWMDQQGLGHRIDAVLNVPEIGKTDWMTRASSIRIALSALWSLVYEEGPGKSEFAQTLTSSKPKACFQLSANPNCLVLRLIYEMPNWTPKDALTGFWPSNDRPSSPAQLLRRYCDFLRVHRVAETPDVEIVAAFFKPAPADKAPGQIQTLWIEPLTSRLFDELPYEKPGANKPHLKPLTNAIPQRPEEAASAAREKSIEDLNIQIKELRRALREREAQVDELRAGGLSKQAPPPDADSLLDAFTEFFYSSRLKLQQLNSKIAEVSDATPTPRKATDLAELERQLKTLVARQDEWIRKIAALVKTYAEDRKKIKQAG